MTFDPKRAPMFALANFASTIAYLISSPPVVRIVAAAGVDVIGLAAFSFAQGLYISLQRRFPGLLIFPTLEPIVMSQSQMPGDTQRNRIYSGLSLLFKAELICILCAVILTSIAGSEIVQILSRPAYVPYHYVLPVLISSLVLSSSYRMFELVANTNFRQRIFFWLWPLSLVAMLGMYATIHSWGLISALIWPIVEIAMRIGVLTFLLRQYTVSLAFDLSRSILLVLSAGTTIVCLLALRYAAPIDYPLANLVLAAFGVSWFLGSLLVVRPLRPLEYESLVTALPGSMGILRQIAVMITRVEPVIRL